MDCTHKELKCMNCCRRIEPTDIVPPSQLLDNFIIDLLALPTKGVLLGHESWVSRDRINQLINSYKHEELSS